MLQVDSRWVFELSTTARAFSRSAAASTYTWQLPTPVSITGTVDSSTTVLISDAPPRGISTSTRPRARISSLTESRVVGVEQLDRVGRQPGVGDRLAQHRDDRRVGAHRRARAAQQHRVAGLEADAGGVGGHVRPALVDDADHAERHPDLPQLQAVGQGRAAHHVADRVGQRGQLAQRRRPWRRPAPRVSASRSIIASAARRRGRCRHVHARWRRRCRRYASTSRSAISSSARPFGAGGGGQLDRAPRAPGGLLDRVDISSRSSEQVYSS